MIEFQSGSAVKINQKYLGQYKLHNSPVTLSGKHFFFGFPLNLNNMHLSLVIQYCSPSLAYFYTLYVVLALDFVDFFSSS